MRFLCWLLVVVAALEFVTSQEACPQGETFARVVQVATQENGACARLDDGTVKCWGDNSQGQLGVENNVNIGGSLNQMGNNLVPVDLGTGRTATSIAGGASHFCALLDDSALKCWGSNGNGQLGAESRQNFGMFAGSLGDALLPINLGTGRTAVMIGLGGWFSCALLDNGDVKCWGENFMNHLGQGHTNILGDDPNEMGDFLPIVPLGGQAKSISVASASACATLIDDTVKCWGEQFGNSIITVNLGSSPKKQIFRGKNSICAVLNDNTLKCWGSNRNGNIGSGAIAEYNYLDAGDAVPAIALGQPVDTVECSKLQYSCCAILSDGNVKCWGQNDRGQLGQGDQEHRGDNDGEIEALNSINLGTDRTAVSISFFRSVICAVLDNGGLKCWGQNVRGHEAGLGFAGDIGDEPGEMGDNLPFTSLGCAIEEPCGNNLLDAGEECDDGNTIGGDGCSATCTNECPAGTTINAAGDACECDAAGASLNTEVDACECDAAGASINVAGDACECDATAASLNAAGDTCECDVAGALFNAAGDACESTCSDGSLNQDETGIDCGGARCAVCTGATTESYSVAVSSQLGACPAGLSGSSCWIIDVALSGTPPASSKQALYLHSGSASAVTFPCSLSDDKCDCLTQLAGAYNATTVETATVCAGGYDDGAFPAIASSMYNATGAVQDSGIQVSATGSSYTIVVSESTLGTIGASTATAGGQRWELHVGFVELLPVGNLDVFDAVRHETRLTLEWNFFATFSSVSAQESTALTFANARAHHVHGAAGDEYYLAVSFVVEAAGTAGNISGIQIPVASIMVEDGDQAPIGVACDSTGSFTGDATAFNDACGPFPSDSSPPFCTGTLHVSGSSGLASLYIPLVQMPDEDSVVVEFVISTEGVGGPVLETFAVTISNLGLSTGGFVQWCRADVSAVQDTIQDSGLAVRMYAGVVLPEETGLASLLVLNDNNALGAIAEPVTRATVLDGVISVTASLTDSAGYAMELVQLSAAYVTGAGGAISTHINAPLTSFHSATGLVSLDTSKVCQDQTAGSTCLTKNLVVNGQADAAAVEDLEVLPVLSASEGEASAWLQGVAGTSNPYVAEVGAHFQAQLTATSVDAAYWINPRADTSATAVAVGQSVSTTVVVFGLWKVTPAVGGRRSSRFLLQAFGEGSDALASGAVRLEVSKASLAASLLGVSPDLVTTWRIGMSVSNTEACLHSEALMQTARSRLLLALKTAASPIRDVHITELDRASIDCQTPGARRLLAPATPPITVEALIIFEEDKGTQPYIDVAKLEAAPGIATVAQSDAGDRSAVRVIVKPAENDGGEQAVAPQDSASNGSDSSVLVIVAGAAGAVTVLAVGVSVWMWRTREPRSIMNVTALEPMEAGLEGSGSASGGTKRDDVLSKLEQVLMQDPPFPPLADRRGLLQQPPLA